MVVAAGLFLTGCNSSHFAGAGPIYLDKGIEYLRAATALRFVLLSRETDLDAAVQANYQPIPSPYPNFGLRREALWLSGEVHFPERTKQQQSDQKATDLPGDDQDGESSVNDPHSADSEDSETSGDGADLAKNETGASESEDFLTPEFNKPEGNDSLGQDPGSQPFVLEVATPRLRSIKFYQVFEGQVVATLEGTEASRRDHPFFRFPLVETAGPSRLYVRLVSDDALTLPIYLWRADILHQTDTLRHFGFGAFFGLMFSLSIYNFFIFFSTRDRAYLYYVLYILGFGTFLSVVYGYQSYFLPLATYEQQALMAPLFSVITSIFALLFSHGFLLIRKFSTILSRICLVFIGLGVPLLALLPVVDIKLGVVLANIYPMISVILVTANIVQAYRSGFKPASYFALAWSFLLISVVYFVLGNMGVVRGSFLSHYGSLFGASLEATLLSLALGYRINDLRQRQEEAQKQILEEQTRALKLQQTYTESFRRFVPDQFLHYLKKDSILDVKRGDSIQSEMTVLFSDLRNFTQFSESAGEELVFHFLNLYLEQMQPIIHRHGGFIDKFIGDAIMALFPDPEKAALASVEMVSELRSMQSQQSRPVAEPGEENNTGTPDSALMESGCGLHHGSLMLGTVGSSDRLETTVIGDTVNMASRLESLNKSLGTRVLISKSVQQSIPLHSTLHQFMRQIGNWSIRGKSETQALFEVFMADPEKLRDFKAETKTKIESVSSSLAAARKDAALRQELLQELERHITSVPAGYNDGPALYLLQELRHSHGEG